MNKTLLDTAMQYLSEGEVQVSVDGQTLPASSFPRRLRRKWAKDLAKNEQTRLRKSLPEEGREDDNQR